MASFDKLLREIRKTLLTFYLFNNLLSTLVVFLFSYLVLSITTFHPYYAVIPALMYMIISTYVRTKESMVRKVEDKYGVMNEKLRTAAQYKRISNPVVDDLKKEVLSESHNINSSSFFHTKTTSVKIWLSVGLCFLIIFSSLFDYHFFDMKYYLQGQLDKIPEIIKEQINVIQDKQSEKNVFEGLLPDEDDRAGTLANRDIYGDKKFAQLGDEIVNVEMQSLNFRLSLEEEQELEKEEFEDSFPSEIYAEGSSAFMETFARRSDQNVVKRYFKSLTSNTRG